MKHFLGALVLTKDNVECMGSTVNLVIEISIEVGEDKAVNLDNNQELLASCQTAGSCNYGVNAFVHLLPFVRGQANIHELYHGAGRWSAKGSPNLP